MPLSHLVLRVVLVLSLSACDAGGGKGGGGGGGGADGADGGDGGGGGGGSGNPYPDCGQTTSTDFYIQDLQILIDPVDFAGEPWDWDGGGITDFEEEYGFWLELAADLAGYGEAYDVAELLLPYVEDRTEVIASEYVSPDPFTEWSLADAAGGEAYLGLDDFPDNQNLIRYQEVELFMEPGGALYIDIYDEDLSFDDDVGYEELTTEFLQESAGCGPLVFHYSDDLMRDWGTRVRALGIIVEPW